MRLVPTPHLSAVRQWCYNASAAILQKRIPIPALLAPRVLGAREGQVMPTTDHWLDGLETAVNAHIAAFTEERDELVKTAMPPAVVFDHVFNAGDLALLDAGVQLQRTYHTALRLLRQDKEHLSRDDYDFARSQAEAYLYRFLPEEQRALLRGAIVSAYLADTPVDTVLWLSSATSGQGQIPGIAHVTIQALREIGVLDEIGETREGLLVYPGASVSTPVYPPSIGISGVWFNWLRAWQQAHGELASVAPGDVSKARATWAKARVAELVDTQFRGLVLTIQPHGDRKVAITRRGNLFGYISKDSAERVPDGEIMVRFAICRDGNLRCIWLPVVIE